MNRMAMKSCAVILAGLCATGAHAQESHADLAKQLSNPVSSLISVPFQFNVDRDIGPEDDGDRLLLNIQPVIPISISDDMNLISRTILPVIAQDDVFPGVGDQTGTGDTVQSLFFSPKAPTESGWIWGAGPVIVIPTGTDDLLGSDKWSIGPTAVALRQQGPWTYGALANQVWSIAGNEDRSDVNAMFLQPFVTYTTPTAWTFGGNLEATFDWENNQETVPLNLFVNKVTRFGNQLVQVGGGLRYYLDSPDSGPEGLGFRINFVLLFPR